MMNMLIVSKELLRDRAMSELDYNEWRVVIPSVFSSIWNGSGKDIPLETLRQYLPRFDNIYIEEGVDIESTTLLHHAINALSLKEYHLCDLQSIDDIATSISNSIFIDENYANSKAAEYAINNLFANQLSKAIKTSIIEKRVTEYKEKFPRASFSEINNLSKGWYNKLQNFYVLLPTLAGLSWIVKAERNILAYDPKNIYRIAVQYIKDGENFIVPYNTAFTDETIQERTNALEYLRSSTTIHKVSFYQREMKDVRPSYRPIILSFLQSKMFYLYNFPIAYSTKIARRLFHSGLITDPSTNSYNIPFSYSSELIRYLNEKYGDEFVRQNPREYKSHDNDDNGCAIIPTHFEEMYDPMNVENTHEFSLISFDDLKMKKDTLLMYSLIFKVTEWIQMKDAIYDVSTLQIKAGNKVVLEAKSNYLVDVYDPHLDQYVEQKCWRMVNTELLGALSSSEDQPIEGHINILPELSYDETLAVTSVEFFTTSPKRPPRFGVGRFNTQILGGKGIGTASSYHIIQNNLLLANLVSLAGTMLHPTEAAMETIEWCENYLPLFLDEKHIQEYWSRLDAIRFNGDSPEQLISEYAFMIDETLKNIGFSEMCILTDKQITLAKSIIIKNHIHIDNEEQFFADQEKVKMLIDMYTKNDNRVEDALFKCPICRQGYVFKKEYVNTQSGEISPYYACEHSKCFVMFDKKIDEFFITKGMDLDESERLEALTNISSKQHLKKSGYMFKGFMGKNRKPYEAKVKIDTFTTQANKLIYTLKLEF